MNPYISPDEIVEVVLDRPRKMALTIGALEDASRELQISRVDASAVLERVSSGDLHALAALAWAMLRQCDADLEISAVKAMLTPRAIQRFTVALGKAIRTSDEPEPSGGPT